MTNYDNTDEIHHTIDAKYNQLADAIYQLVLASFSLGKVPQFGAFGFISNLKHPNKGEYERLMYLYDAQNADQSKRVFVNIKDLDMSHDIFSIAKPHSYYMTGTDRPPKDPSYADIRKYHFHLVVPIFNAKKRVVGLISLHAMRDNAFTTDDAILLRNIADHISEKLDDIELSLQIAERMNSINQIDKDIINTIRIGKDDEKSRQDIWQFVLEKSCELTGADSGSIFKISSDQTTIIREATHPATADRLARFPTSGEGSKFIIATQYTQRLSVKMAYHVLNKKDPQEFLLVRNRRKEHPAHEGYVSALSVPIMGADDTLKGILTLVSDEEDHFTNQHIAFAKTLAGQAAVATASVEQVNRFYRMVITSHEFSKKTFDDVLQVILKTIIDILDPNGTRKLIGTLRRVNIFTNTLDLVNYYCSRLFDDYQLQELEDYFQKNMHFPIEEHVDAITDTRKPHGLVGRVVCDCTRYKIDDTENLTDEARDYLSMPNVRSIMSVGIWGKNAKDWDGFQMDEEERQQREKRDNQYRHAVRGVISIMSPDIGAFNKIEFEILTYFANLIALVWAYHLQKRRIEVLMEIAEEWQKDTIRRMEDLQIWDKVHRIFTIGSTNNAHKTFNARGTFSEYEVNGKLIWKRANDEEKNWLPQYIEEMDVFVPDGNFSREGVQAWVAYHNLKRKQPHQKPILVNIPNTTVQSGYLTVEYPTASPAKAYIIKQNNPIEPNAIDGLYRDEMIHHYNGEQFRTRSELCVPIIDTNSSTIQLRGLINIESPTTYAFDEDDEQIIEALARQVWNALNRIDYHIGSDSEDYTYHIAASTHNLAGELKRIIEDTKQIQREDEKITPILNKLLDMQSQIDEIEQIKKALDNFGQAGENQTTLTDLLNSVFNEVYEKRKNVYGIPKNRDDAFQVICQVDDTLYLTKDKGQLLRLVFDNFFKNSFTHRRTDGVDLKIIVTIRKTNIKDMLEVEVRDNGKGIAPKDRDTLFMRHTHRGTSDALSNRAEARGMGIGLFLAKKILIYKIGGGIHKKPDTKHPDDLSHHDHATYTAFTLWIPRQ